MACHVREIGKELDLHHQAGRGGVSPSPDLLSVGREATGDEGAFESNAVDRASLDLEIELDVDIRRTDVLPWRPTAQEVGDQSAEQDELRGVAIGVHEPHQGCLSEPSCVTATNGVRHR